VVAFQNLLGTLVAAWLECQVECAGLENDMAVCGLCIDRNGLASAGADLGSRVECPQGSGAEDEHLIVDNVLAQACPAAPTKSVHGLALTEVRITSERFLVRRPGRLQPALGAEVLWIRVL
jgi:hypothetical protein